MIKLKKMIASLLACALLAGLCACGGAQDQPEEKKDMGEGFYAVDTENSLDPPVSFYVCCFY